MAFQGNRRFNEQGPTWSSDSQPHIALYRSITNTDRKEFIKKLSDCLSSAEKALMYTAILKLPSNFIDEQSDKFRTYTLSTTGESLYRTISYIVFGTERFYDVIDQAIETHVSSYQKQSLRMYRGTDTILNTPRCESESDSEYDDDDLEYHTETKLGLDAIEWPREPPSSPRPPPNNVDVQAISNFFNVRIYLFNRDKVVNGKPPKEIRPSVLNNERNKPAVRAFYIHHDTERAHLYEPLVEYSSDYYTIQTPFYEGNSTRSASETFSLSQQNDSEIKPVYAPFMSPAGFFSPPHTVLENKRKGDDGFKIPSTTLIRNTPSQTKTISDDVFETPSLPVQQVKQKSKLSLKHKRQNSMNQTDFAEIKKAPKKMGISDIRKQTDFVRDKLFSSPIKLYRDTSKEYTNVSNDNQTQILTNNQRLNVAPKKSTDDDLFMKPEKKFRFKPTSVVKKIFKEKENKGEAAQKREPSVDRKRKSKVDSNKSVPEKKHLSFQDQFNAEEDNDFINVPTPKRSIMKDKPLLQEQTKPASSANTRKRRSKVDISHNVLAKKPLLLRQDEFVLDKKPLLLNQEQHDLDTFYVDGKEIPPITIRYTLETTSAYSADKRSINCFSMLECSRVSFSDPEDFDIDELDSYNPIVDSGFKITKIAINGSTYFEVFEGISKYFEVFEGEEIFHVNEMLDDDSIFMFSPNQLVGYEMSEHSMAGIANKKTYIMAVLLKNSEHANEITWYKDSDMLMKGRNLNVIRITDPGEYTVSVKDDNGITHRPDQTVNIGLSKSKTYGITNEDSFKSDRIAASSSNNVSDRIPHRPNQTVNIGLSNSKTYDITNEDSFKSDRIAASSSNNASEGIPHRPDQTVNIGLSESKTYEESYKSDQIASTSSNNVSISSNSTNQKINAVYQMDNSEHLTIVVPSQQNDHPISTDQAIDYAIKTVLKGMPVKIRQHILGDRSYNSLVTRLNKSADANSIDLAILNHFKRVVREAKPANLLSCVVKNVEANAHRLAVIKMRNNIRYIENRIEDDKDLDSICMVLSDNKEAKDNLFGYYKNGENTNEWLAVPINTEVFKIQNQLKQNQFVTKGEYLFFIHKSTLGYIHLFCTYVPPHYVNIPSISKDDVKHLWLCRTNRGNILIIDHVNNRYLSLVNSTLSIDWIPLFKIQKCPLSITSSVVYLLIANENEEAKYAERFIISVPSVNGKQSICDYHDTTITEYVMDPDKQHRFEYIVAKTQYVQIGINPIHHASEDTVTYIMLSTEDMDKIIGKYSSNKKHPDKGEVYSEAMEALIKKYS